MWVSAALLPSLTRYSLVEQVSELAEMSFDER
jgi:hypothetical protein